MIVPITMSWLERRVEFVMDLDPQNASDFGVLHYVQAGGPCEPETAHVMMRAIQPGDVVVDGGANVGFFTLLMSKLVEERGQVLAFEPGAENCDKLRANLALNDCRNVTIHDNPLWGFSSPQPFYNYQDGGFNALWPRQSDDVGTEMLTTTLDRECSGKVSFIKLDIEGAEEQALLGATVVLKNKPLVIAELNPVALIRAKSSPQQLRAQMFDRGYKCFGLSETGGFPTYIPPEVKLVSSKQNTNVLFATWPQVCQWWPEAVL